jgi:hypothetical protein
LEEKEMKISDGRTQTQDVHTKLETIAIDFWKIDVIFSDYYKNICPKCGSYETIVSLGVYQTWLVLTCNYCEAEFIYANHPTPQAVKISRKELTRE